MKCSKSARLSPSVRSGPSPHHGIQRRSPVIAFLTLLALLAGGALSHGQLVSFQLPEPVLISSEGTPEVALDTTAVPAMESLESVSITIAHEWVGDLTITLVPPSGRAIVLFDRVGVDSGNEFGSSACLGAIPSSPNAQGFGLAIAPQTYHFALGGADFTAAARAGDGALSFVPSDPTYAAQAWTAGPFAAGVWQLVVSDGADMSGGEITGAQLTMTPVPEPSQAALVVGLGLSALALVRKALSARRSRVTMRPR